MARIRTALILILLVAVPMTLAAEVFLDLSIGDSGQINCPGLLANVTAVPQQIQADCVAVVTATSTATPSNLLINGTFSDGFAGWEADCTGCWDVSVKLSNPGENHTAAQCDQDYNQKLGAVGGWPTGLEGSLWQIVAAPEDHSQVTFTAIEIQHHGTNTATWQIDGQLASGEWVTAWQRPSLEPDVPEAQTQTNFYTNTYEIDVSQAEYAGYRLGATCYIGECIEAGQQCGWKFTGLSLEVSD